ncbi:hypothetical protein HXX76_013266 [Chlamydomonas incerta]|uniref:Protein kinase domain-containing protein n=1 Tax=Chlamydomonas incerta TaxID=51695 RepID=A0A835SMA2_CHLIN|nr:hypothetical protein HXX76_013266 [Chlamydomonas incerta]|eukprot:KAG2426078.1 hypothetical protein HXX76_013266 [Chlamydomonas incerta]
MASASVFNFLFRLSGQLESPQMTSDGRARGGTQCTGGGHGELPPTGAGGVSGYAAQPGRLPQLVAAAASPLARRATTTAFHRRSTTFLQQSSPSATVSAGSAAPNVPGTSSSEGVGDSGAPAGSNNSNNSQRRVIDIKRLQSAHQQQHRQHHHHQQQQQLAAGTGAAAAGGGGSRGNDGVPARDGAGKEWQHTVSTQPSASRPPIAAATASESEATTAATAVTSAAAAAEPAPPRPAVASVLVVRRPLSRDASDACGSSSGRDVFSCSWTALNVGRSSAATHDEVPPAVDAAGGGVRGADSSAANRRLSTLDADELLRSLRIGAISGAPPQQHQERTIGSAPAPAAAAAAAQHPPLPAAASILAQQLPQPHPSVPAGVLVRALDGLVSAAPSAAGPPPPAAQGDDPSPFTSAAAAAMAATISEGKGMTVAAAMAAACAASAAAGAGGGSVIERRGDSGTKGVFVSRPMPHPGTLHVSPTAPVAMVASGRLSGAGCWVLADYQVTRKIYDGYASSVYKAHCRHSRQDVVLKAYNLQGLSPFLRHQVLRELDIHSRLAHDGIVQLYGAFRDGDAVVLVQEYMRGGSLTRVCRELQGGRMSEFQAMHLVLTPLLQALKYLHARGIVHRDIKPDNLLFTPDWQLKLCDFGVSVCLHEERAVTKTGSKDYMAPEVVVCPLKRGPEDNKDNAQLAYTPAVDVWSLGVLMYQLLVGFTPFPAGPPAPAATAAGRAAGAAATAEPADALRFPSSVSEPARAFVRACLQLHPGDRPTVPQLMQHEWILKSLRHVVHLQMYVVAAGGSREPAVVFAWFVLKT